jgi:ABC-2 type transport system permease protein
MRNIWTIFKRELRGYFVSPIAYLVAFAVLVLLGISFNTDINYRIDNTLRPNGTVVLSNFAFLMVFFAPLLTMRLFAEEAREGTLELMMTMPSRDVELVVGKFLGAWSFYTFLLMLTMAYQILLLSITNWAPQPEVIAGENFEFVARSRLDIGPIIAGYIGMFLYGGATIAIGTMFSAVTENQIVAGFLSMAVLLSLWVGDIAGLVPASILSRDVIEALRFISLQAHYSTSFLRGIVTLEDVYFYVALIAVTLFITTRLVESRRWR